MFYETGLQYSLDVQMERLAEELPGRVHGLAIAILQQCRISTELSMKLYIIPLGVYRIRSAYHSQ